MIHQERDLGDCLDVFQPGEPLRCDTLGFQVNRGVENFVVVDKADGHDMRPTFRAQSR